MSFLQIKRDAESTRTDQKKHDRPVKNNIGDTGKALYVWDAARLANDWNTHHHSCCSRSWIYWSLSTIASVFYRAVFHGGAATRKWICQRLSIRTPNDSVVSVFHLNSFGNAVPSCKRILVSARYWWKSCSENWMFLGVANRKETLSISISRALQVQC